MASALVGYDSDGRRTKALMFGNVKLLEPVWFRNDPRKKASFYHDAPDLRKSEDVNK